MVNIQGVCPFPHCTVRIVSSKYFHCVHLDELDLCTKETIQKYSNLSPVEPQDVAKVPTPVHDVEVKGTS